MIIAAFNLALQIASYAKKERDIIMQNLSEFEHLSPANRRKVLQEVKKASQEKARKLGVINSCR